MTNRHSQSRWGNAEDWLNRESIVPALTNNGLVWVVVGVVFAAICIRFPIDWNKVIDLCFQ